MTRLAERNPTIQELYLSGIDEIVGETNRSPKVLERQAVKHAELTKIIQYLGHNLVCTTTFLHNLELTKSKSF